MKMENEQLIDISIIEIKDPSSFQARIFPDEDGSEETNSFQKAYQSWTCELENNEPFVMVNYIPQMNEICAVKLENRTWQRAKVERILHLSKGEQACCFFVDLGTREQIALHRLRKLPVKYQTILPQVCTLKLSGICPQSLEMGLTDSGFEVAKRPSKKWDSSVATFFQSLVKDSLRAQIKVLHKDSRGVLNVCLYLQYPGGHICVNDKLVEEEYAIYSEASKKLASETESDSSFAYSPSISPRGELQGHISAPQNDRTSDVSIMSEEKNLQVVLEKIKRYSKYSQKMRDYQSDTEVLRRVEDTAMRSTSKDRQIDSTTCIHKLSLERTIDSSKSKQRLSLDDMTRSKQRLSLDDMTRSKQRLSLDDMTRSKQRSSLDGKMSNLTLDQRLPLDGLMTWSTSNQRSLLGNEEIESMMTDVNKQTVSIPVNQSSCDGCDTSLPALKMLTPDPYVSSHSVFISSDSDGTRIPELSNVTARTSVQQSLSDSGDSLFFLKDLSLDMETSLESVPGLKSKVSSGGGRGRDLSEYRFSQIGQTRNILQTHIKQVSPLFESEEQLVLPVSDERSVYNHSLPMDNKPAVNCGLTYTLKNQAHNICRDKIADAEQDIGISPPKGISCFLGREQHSKSARDMRHDTLDSREDGRLSLLQAKSRVQGQAEGKKLIESLTKASSKCDTTRYIPQVCRPDLPLPSPFLGTSVFGKLAPSPVYDLEMNEFEDFIKQYLQEQEFTPSGLHAYTWPSILRGLNIVGIATPYPPFSKTLAYIPPLLTQLLHTSSYMNLPKGCGPKALIIVPTWKKAQELFDLIMEMAHQHITLTTICIYAGGSEETQVLPLLRGCDILIATPYCLLRMLDRCYTNLSRLCHLVLDDAQILTEQFTKEIRQLMSLYADVLKERQYSVAPIQIMVFTTEWSLGVEAFCNAYQSNVVVVSNSRLESSVFGKVQQIVHMCFTHMRASNFCDLLDNLTSGPNHCRIIVVTKDPESLEDIVKLTHSRSLYALVIHPTLGTNPEEVKELVEKWQKQTSSSAILVVTDDMVTSLNVTNAHVLLNYDLPDSKTKFGNRLACMHDYFEDRFQKRKPEIQPVSHIMVTEESVNLAFSLCQFLHRSHATIPKEIYSMLRGVHEGKNKDPSKPLCESLKAFGECRNENSCLDRHLLLNNDFVKDESNESWPPHFGEVKIKVVHIINASHFFARLLEHRIPGENVRDLSVEYVKLIMEMTHFFSKSSNQTPYSLEQGLAAVRDVEGIYRRARVLTSLKDFCEKKLRTVRVQYVDEGLTDSVSLDQLWKLPSHIQEIPPQAVEVYVCRVKPLDGDTEWTAKSNEYAQKHLADKEFMGRIVFRMVNSLWLDPLAERIKLRALQTQTITMIVRSELLKCSLAEDNPDHIKNLYHLSEGKINIPQNLKQKYLSLPKLQYLETELLDISIDFNEVFVSAVDNPHHFFLQQRSHVAQLEEMVQKLNTFFNASSKKSSESDYPKTEEKEVSSSLMSEKRDNPSSETLRNESFLDLEAGGLCAAKFSEDNRWYRGRLLEKVDSGWKIFFIDYGECKIVSECDIKPLPDAFCVLPAQAIECSLAHVQPLDDDWTDESAEAIWDMTHYLNGEKKFMLAKVVDTIEAECAGLKKYVVDLYDTNVTQRDLRVSQELLWLRLVKSYSEELMNLFPKVVISTWKMYTVGEKICDLCSALYWSEDEDKMNDLAKTIAKSLISDVNLTDCDLLTSGALEAAIKLIGYARSNAANFSILTAVVECIQTKPSMFFDAVGKRFTLQVIRCIEQNQNPDLQLQALIAVDSLSRIDNCRPVLENKDLFSACCDILQSDPDLQLVAPVCSFLTIMLQNSQLCQDMVRDSVVCETAIRMLSETAYLEVQEDLLAFLSTVASWESFQAPFLCERARKKIVSLLKEASSPECILHCATICQCLCQNSRRNKRLLLEEGLVLVLKDLLNTSLPSPAREICMDLESSLAIRVPQQEVLAGVPVTLHQSPDDTQRVKQPCVKWSQNSFRILLTVQISGAKKENFTIMENQIQFRHNSGAQVYEFNYILFGNLELEKCYIKVGVNDVQLSLRKQVKGQWSRLRKEKEKLPFIVPDYENLVDSSESEVDDIENSLTLSRKKRVHLPVLQEANQVVKYYFPSSEESEKDSDAELSTDDDFMEKTGLKLKPMP